MARKNRKSNLRNAALLIINQRRSLAASDLNSSCRYVLLVLTTYLSGAEGDYDVWPSVKTLAKETGFSEKTIKNCTKKLEQGGYLVKKKLGRQGCNNNVYGLFYGSDLPNLGKGSAPSVGEQGALLGGEPVTHKVEYTTYTQPTVEGKLKEGIPPAGGEPSLHGSEPSSLGVKGKSYEKAGIHGDCKVLQSTKIKEGVVKLQDISNQTKTNPHKVGSPSYYAHIWVRECGKYFPSMYFGAFFKPKNLKMVKQLADDMGDTEGTILAAVIQRWGECVEYIQEHGEYFSPIQPSLPALLKRADTARQWYDTSYKPAESFLGFKKTQGDTNPQGHGKIAQSASEKAAKKAKIASLFLPK